MRKFDASKSDIVTLFQKGTGMAIIGIAVLILTAVLSLFLIEFYARNEQTSSLQSAADTIADSVAMHAVNTKCTFQEAEQRAETLKEHIEKYVGTKIDKMILDQADFDNNIVSVTLIQEHKKDAHFFGGPYQIQVLAATQFTPHMLPPNTDSKDLQDDDAADK